MADGSSISWTQATWNATTGCTRVSAGCDHCYIDRTPPFRMAHRRFSGPEVGATTGVLLHPDRLTLPLRWRKPRRIFVNSLSDLFHTDVPDEFIARVFAVMALAPQHTFQLLTKRHARMRSLLSGPAFADLVWWEAGKLSLVRNTKGKLAVRPRLDSRHVGTWPLPNVWLGVSVEDQQWADIRIPALLDTPAAVRWISAEPLLGPVDLTRWFPRAGCVLWDGEPTGQDQAALREIVNAVGRKAGLSWVVAGGESGKGARPMHPQWARGLRDQCAAAGVPFHFKQHGEWRPGATGADIIDRPDPVRYVRPDGQVVPLDGEHGQWRAAGWALMSRVGKKAAGRHLDGRTHDDYPAAVVR